MNQLGLDLHELTKKMLPGPENPVWVERNNAFLKEIAPHIRLRALSLDCFLLAVMILVASVLWKLHIDDPIFTLDWLSLIMWLSVAVGIAAISVATGANFRVNNIAMEQDYPYYFLPRFFMLLDTPGAHD